MDIIFYGAGKRGRDALEVFNEKEHENYNLRGFCDNIKKGYYLGYPILFAQDLDDKNLNIVITIEDPVIVGEIYTQLKKKGMDHIYWFKNRRARVKYDDFLEEECESCSCWGDIFLPKVEMHLVDYCNLNCRGCTHFSPLFDTVLPDFSKKMEDIKKLKKKIPYVLLFSMLGGEPFLNPDIVLYIKEIRKIFPHTRMNIVTNGLLIPGLSDNIFRCILENEVEVSISEYRTTHKIIGSIVEKLQSYGIAYNIRPYEEKQKFIKPLSLSDNSVYPNKCISEGCVNIWNGKIARCPTLMYIEQFNNKFNQNLPDEGIMQLDHCPSGSELVRILQRTVPLCKHCINYEIEWEQCGRELDISDFATPD